MVTWKQNNPKSILLTRKFSAAKQKVILHLTSKPNITTTQCLTLANKTLRQHTDLLSFNFVRTYLTECNNLVIDTLLVTRGTDYEPNFPGLRQTFGNHIKIDRIDGETRWSKFIHHGIPLDTPMGDKTGFLRNNYPEPTLAKTPKWLIANENKNASSKKTAPGKQLQGW